MKLGKPIDMSKPPPKNPSEFIGQLRSRGTHFNKTQVTAAGVNHSGVIVNRTRSRVTLHTQIEYGDMRSYLRCIIKCRPFVHNRLQFILKDVRKGLPVTKDAIEQFRSRIWGQ